MKYFFSFFLKTVDTEIIKFNLHVARILLICEIFYRFKKQVAIDKKVLNDFMIYWKENNNSMSLFLANYFLANSLKQNLCSFCFIETGHVQWGVEFRIALVTNFWLLFELSTRRIHSIMLKCWRQRTIQSVSLSHGHKIQSKLIVQM